MPKTYKKRREEKLWLFITYVAIVRQRGRLVLRDAMLQLLLMHTATCALAHWLGGFVVASEPNIISIIYFNIAMTTSTLWGAF